MLEETTTPKGQWASFHCHQQSVRQADVWLSCFMLIIWGATRLSGSCEPGICSSDFAHSFPLQYRHQAHSILGDLRLSACYCFLVGLTTWHRFIDKIITLISGFSTELNAANPHSHTS